MDTIFSVPELEIKELLKVTLDASERSLRQVIFNAPKEFNFEKPLSRQDANFWFSRVFLALLAYSCYFFGDKPELKTNRRVSFQTEKSYGAFWKKILDYYNTMFQGKIGFLELDYYASGLKEDNEKGYSASGNTEKGFEMLARDSNAISSELLKNIWDEDIETNPKKGMLLGGWIWKAHQQIVQPFLPNLLN